MPSGPSKFTKVIYQIKESKPYLLTQKLFNFRSTHFHTGQEIYGQEGEKTVQEYLVGKDVFAVFERITPQKDEKKPYREIDAIIFDKGILCCVEIKRYKGTIEFYEPRPPKHNQRSGESNQKRPEFEKFYKIRVTKEGSYGEGNFEKVHSNPKLRVKSYIYNFKHYLKDIKSPLATEHFHNLLVFIRDDSDITAIHSFEDGIIYHDEICEYMEMKSKYGNSSLDTEIVKTSLSSLPTWDVVTARAGGQYYGVLKNDGFTCALEDSRSVVVPYACTDQINFTHKSRFSPTELNFISEGKQNSYKVNGGRIPLYRFGETDYFKTNSIEKVVLGANPLREKKTINIVKV